MNQGHLRSRGLSAECEDYVVEQEFPAIGRRKKQLNAHSIVGKLGDHQLILLAMENVS